MAINREGMDSVLKIDGLRAEDHNVVQPVAKQLVCLLLDERRRNYNNGGNILSDAPGDVSLIRHLSDPFEVIAI